MSATIIILDDPAGINQKRKHFIDAGENLLDFLITEYGRCGFSVPTVIYKNGLEESNIILRTDSDKMHVHVTEEITDSGMILKDADQITIIHTPLGIETVLAVASFILAVVAVALVDVPEVPEFKTPTESPNNSLTGQTNIARPLQRIPDLYGVNRIYPDLIAKSYSEFINNVKFLTEYMCIGRGEHLIEDVRSGDTLITDIAGATFEIFEPFTSPPELLNVTDSNEVNGQEIIAPNADTIFALADDINYTANNTFESENSTFLEFGELAVGDNVKIIGSGYTSFVRNGIASAFEFSDVIFQTSSLAPTGIAPGDFITFSSTASNDGVFLVTVVVQQSEFIERITCADPVTGLPVVFVNGADNINFSTVFPNEDDFTFASFAVVPGSPDKYIVTVSETSFTLLTTASNNFASNAESVSTLGPFNVPGNPDEVWFDVRFPRGLIDGNDPYSVRLNFKLQQIDDGGSPIGIPEDNFKVYSGFTNDPLSVTFKAIPLVTDVLYEATVERITDTLSSSDQSTWTRLAGVENVDVSDFGNVTTILVKTRATDQAVKVQERKLNLRDTRKLVTFENGSVTLTPQPTAKFADALLNELTDPFMGNKPVSQIDLEEIYAIQDEIDSNPIYGDKLGRFCYSFSNSRTPVGDELKTIANAARAIVTRRGDIVSSTRDELQELPVTVFNKRNKKPDSETKTIKFNKPSDFDGVELLWVEEDSGDGFTVIFPEDLTGQNLKRIEGAGIKNYDQAWNRAKYEYLKLQYQRISIETTVTKEGLLLSLNDLINSVDGTNVKAQDGEITAIAGLIVSSTERVNFEGGSATVILRAEDGEASAPIVVTPRNDTDFGYVLNQLPAFAIVIRGDNFIQKGTLYNFFPDSNELADSHLVQNISPGDDGYVDLTLINYAPEIYAPDSEVPTGTG